MAAASPSPTEDALLDAASECVLAVGVRRTTMSDVARRAGVSRMTLYRCFPDAATLWSSLLTREVETATERAEQRASDHVTARERLVEAVVQTVEELTRNPLLPRILEVDPELLLPYVTDRFGESQRFVLARTEQYLAEGRRDGSIRIGDPTAMAYWMVAIATSYVTSIRIIEQEADPTSVLGELRVLLDAYLRTDR